MNDLDQISCNDYKVGRVSLLSLNKVSLSVELCTLEEDFNF